MGLKIVFYIYYKLFYEISIEGTLFGGGNDGDYYNNYALGYVDFAANYWPVILRFLNENELYNRDVIGLILFVMSLTLTPYLYYKMVKIQANEIEPVMAGSFFLISYYPTLFFLTMDIYRDVLMFTILLFSFLIYKKILESNLVGVRVAYFFIYLGLAYFLYLMRVYLGFAMALTPFVYLIFSKTKRYFKTWIIVYFVTLILVQNFGGFDEILNYRERFVIYGRGGSTLGIGLLDKNPIMFIFYYFYSFLLQFLGLFLININAIFVFFFETIPFILAFIYLFKNVKFMSKFVIFLLTFFTIYTTIWLLGNDNLGTAVRLRIPSYLVIYACMFIIYQTKIVVDYEKIKRKKLEI
tara:strand:- start:60 stop:1118 length:1059 start_codon:yes stop_codon:yes gene_type:complete